MPAPSRRNFLQHGVIAGTAALASGTINAAAGINAAAAFTQTSKEATRPLETLVPTRTITRPPGYHWFGYYDKRQFDQSNTLVLSNRVSFEGRSPRVSDKIYVGYIDTENGDQWHTIGESRAWGWQQGCMLQWIGETDRRVLWNDQIGDQHVCRIHDIQSGNQQTIDRPIYTISPDGRYGLSVDFRRINNLRPGYGYSGLPDPNVSQRAPSDSGIWRVDLQTGDSRLIVSLADVAAMPWDDGQPSDDKSSKGNLRSNVWHYFNHLLINPSGTRFCVLHRYRPKFDPATLQFDGGFVTRMLTFNMDGSDPYVLDPSGYTSHFIWQDDQRITMWTRPRNRKSGFYTLQDHTQKIVAVGHDKMPTNGHNTYLPAPYQEWILNDTYPRNGSRQTVFLYHPPTNRRIDLGHFPSPSQYRGEWRCDTHPRSSNDGRKICIDSPHALGGRQLHLMDISKILHA
ncbi:MAG: hypothetical protein AAFP90_11265 [Planctomycetota bacterium]